jgi:pimeloyl-ACP methyl ester carboxylesterase
VRRLSHEDRMSGLAGVIRAYGDPRFLSSPELFFPKPRPAEPTLVHVRDDKSQDGVSVYDASWASEHEHLFLEHTAAYAEHAKNRTAHARLLLHREPRPAILAIHGYLGGQFAFEERAFPVRWMNRRGFDVALVVLPFHAQRARASGPPLFPGADPRFTIEGCRQSIADLRAIASYLKARGSPSVGVMGMSLGGYVTSLLATIDPDLSFAVPIIPLCSFADFAHDQHRFGVGPAAEEQYRAYDEAMRVVSPLARPSAISSERVLVLAAAHDHITPKVHAERLAEHFAAPLIVFPGGHLLQFGRGDAFREVGRLWRRLGFGASRRVA